MSIPKILLITGTTPGDDSVGAIYLKDLLRVLPSSSYICYSVVYNNELNKNQIGTNLIIKEWPFDKILGGSNNFFGKARKTIIRQFIRAFKYKNIENDILNICIGNKIDIVWIVLNKPSIFYIAKRIIKKVKLQIITTIWDPPEQILIDHKFDKISRLTYLNDFKQVLKNSRKIAVISENMQKYYKKKYNVNSIIMRHGLNIKHRDYFVPFNEKKKTFIIGFAGTTYANIELNSLITALSKSDWKINGKSIKIMIFSSDLNISCKGQAEIQYFGWRSADDLNRYLMKVDINYLPYWFDKKHTLSTKLCFPTKLSTYIAAGKPILYHGPNNSSPSFFIEKKSIGLCCYSLSHKEIIETIQIFISKKNMYNKMKMNVNKTYLKELNYERFVDQFASLLNINRMEFKEQ